MAIPDSPLQIIKQKELDLRQRVENAQRLAEARIQTAREEAERLIARADQEGRAEAEACYQCEIEKAQQEAGAIVEAAHEEAAALRQQAALALDSAARYIVELVLPAHSPSQTLHELDIRAKQDAFKEVSPVQ